MVAPEICGRCCEEIRHGVRDGATGWWHRDSVDHQAIHGRPTTSADLAEVERQLDLPRERETSDGIETYTTREHDLKRYRKNAKFKAAEELEASLDEDLEVEVVALPPVEVRCHPVDPDSFAPRSGIRQVINLILKQGWDLRRVTHARGPYVGSKGECLSISDTIVVGAAGPARLDGTIPFAVGSWRDGKFDFAFVGTKASMRKVDATSMKKWIKGIE